MPQPGMNGMEPAFGEAYGSHRGLLSPCPLAMSPQGGRTDYDQSVLLMLGSPASPRKRPFELLSDLVDDGGFGEDQHPERWDVSALDEMARYTKLGLGVGGELLACSEEAILMGRWGRSLEEQEREEEEWKRRDRCAAPAVTQEVQVTAVGKEEGHGSVTIATQGELCAAGKGMGDEQDEEVSQECTVEVYQVAQEEGEEEEQEVVAAGAVLVLEHCSEEHNYSLGQGGEKAARPAHNSQSEEVQVDEVQPEIQGSEDSQANTELEEEEEKEEEEEEEEEEGAEETAVEAELSSSSETECGEFWLYCLDLCGEGSCLNTELYRKQFIMGPVQKTHQTSHYGCIS
ncbi:hypothetical protein ILYODFUR_027945 [Ilyodon furcidens]|uniref:Uncharacterized protein n=1 Tax=Ilyodon furcidens TaxID=33524 RepID=A0ABV0TY93_9TELE